jgi:hypothetical protein
MTEKKKPARRSTPTEAAATEESRPYRVAKTRIEARNIGGYFPAEPVHAFRVLAAQLDKDVQQLLAEGINMVFERHGVPQRIPVFSGRRTKQGRREQSPP